MNEFDSASSAESVGGFGLGMASGVVKSSRPATEDLRIHRLVRAPVSRGRQAPLPRVGIGPLARNQFKISSGGFRNDRAGILRAPAVIAAPDSSIHPETDPPTSRRRTSRAADRLSPTDSPACFPGCIAIAPAASPLGWSSDSRDASTGISATASGPVLNHPSATDGAGLGAVHPASGPTPASRETGPIAATPPATARRSHFRAPVASRRTHTHTHIQTHTHTAPDWGPRSPVTTDTPPGCQRSAVPPRPTVESPAPARSGSPRRYASATRHTGGHETASVHGSLGPNRSSPSADPPVVPPGPTAATRSATRCSWALNPGFKTARPDRDLSCSTRGSKSDGSKVATSLTLSEILRPSTSTTMRTCMMTLLGGPKFHGPSHRPPAPLRTSKSIWDRRKPAPDSI